VVAGRLVRQFDTSFFALSLLVLEYHLRLFTEEASSPRGLEALREFQKAKACAAI